MQLRAHCRACRHQIPGSHAGAYLHAEADPQEGFSLRARVVGCQDLALHAPVAKAACHAKQTQWVSRASLHDMITRLSNIASVHSGNLTNGCTRFYHAHKGRAHAWVAQQSGAHLAQARPALLARVPTPARSHRSRLPWTPAPTAVRRSNLSARPCTGAVSACISGLPTDAATSALSSQSISANASCRCSMSSTLSVAIHLASSGLKHCCACYQQGCLASACAHLQAALALEAGVLEGLDDRQVRVRQAVVLAHHRDVQLSLRGIAGFSVYKVRISKSTRFMCGTSLEMQCSSQDAQGSRGSAALQHGRAAHPIAYTLQDEPVCQWHVCQAMPWPGASVAR